MSFHEIIDKRKRQKKIYSLNYEINMQTYDFSQQKIMNILVATKTIIPF